MGLKEWAEYIFTRWWFYVIVLLALFQSRDLIAIQLTRSDYFAVLQMIFLAFLFSGLIGTIVFWIKTKKSKK